MLEDDEEKRPCFKQLMMLIEKDFRQVLEKFESRNKC